MSDKSVNQIHIGISNNKNNNNNKILYLPNFITNINISGRGH